MNLFKPFRYSGNKARVFRFLRPVPESVTRLVEPFAGSLIFSLQYDLPILAADIDPRIVNLWNWLKTVSEQEILDLVKFTFSHENKFDIRECHHLNENQKNYIRLNCGSMMTGHIGKNLIYTSKPFYPETTLACLPKIRQLVTVLNCDFAELPIQQGDLIFLDPPYIGSGYTYLNTDMRDLADRINQFISSHPDNPIVFTHGDHAPDLFPDYNWEHLFDITLGKARKNSTKRTRSEYVAYINW